MKKLLPAICLFICILLSLSSCTRNYDLKDLFDDKGFEDRTFSKIQHIPDLDGMTYNQNTGSVTMLYSDALLRAFKTAESDFVVYDAGQDKVIKSFSDVSSVFVSSFYTEDLIDYVIVVYTKDGKTEFYDRRGEYVTSVDEELPSGLFSFISINSRFGLLEIGNNIYRANEDGSIDLVGSSDILPPSQYEFIPRVYNITDCANGYYYHQKATSIDVYNKDLEITATWKMADGNDRCSTHVLSNGNVLIQVEKKLSQDANDYTYSVDDEKYSLTSYILNPKNGKLKDVELGYKIADNYNMKWSFADKRIKNVTVILPIEDKILLSDQPKTVSLKNNGKIDGYLFSELKDYNATSRNITQVNENVVLYETKDGGACFVNLDGEILHTFDSYNDFFKDFQYVDNYYIVVDNVIYDWNFTAQYDLEENGMTIAQNSFALILKNEKENSYYRYDKNGSLTKIGSVSDVILEYNYYVVNNAGVYELYNNWGEKIADFESKPNYVHGNGNLAIISVNENGENMYYLLSSK